MTATCDSELAHVRTFAVGALVRALIHSAAGGRERGTAELDDLLRVDGRTLGEFLQPPRPLQRPAEAAQLSRGRVCKQCLEGRHDLFPVPNGKQQRGDEPMRSPVEVTLRHTEQQRDLFERCDLHACTALPCDRRRRERRPAYSWRGRTSWQI
jgi:hypothetical protein